jgi:hypothetical protein
VLVDASGGNRTITLPSASGIDGRMYTIKKVDNTSNPVTIQPQSGQYIDGASSIVLANKNDSVILQSYNGNWYTVRPFRPFVIQSFAPKPPGINDYVVPYATNGTAATTFTFTANRIYWIPFIVWSTVSITGMAVNVTTAASTGQNNLIYVGIYSSTTTYAPNTLITSASFDCSSTGLKTATVSLTLQPGVYWIAIACDITPTIRAVALASAYSLALPSLGTSNTVCWYTSGLSLPSTAPSSGYTALNGSDVPAVGLLYSFV